MIQWWLLMVILLLIFYVSLSQPNIWMNISLQKVTLTTLAFMTLMILISSNLAQTEMVYEPTAHLSYIV
jgi:hypothetical protein